MATIFRIKRSGTAGNPATLAQGELAYSYLTDNGSNGGDRLYVGTGTETGGDAANHVVIGGKFFTDRLDHTAGTLTASSAVVVDASGKIDVFNVDNLTLDGNTLSSTDLNGNIVLSPNGTGVVSVDSSLISNVTDPVSAQDAATKNYVDTNFVSAAAQQEIVEDDVAALFAAGTHSGITVTYADNAEAAGSLSLNVNDPTLTFDGDLSGSNTMTDLGNTTFTLTLDTVNANVGTFGSSTSVPVITVNGKGLITGVTTAAISSTLDIAGETGTDTIDLTTDTLTFAAGEGINTVVTDNTVTISGEDATSANKGIASFDATDFTVTAGAVAVNAITLGTSTLNPGATTLSLTGLQSLAVDNITIDGNGISSTDANGNINLSPNGSGAVDVGSSLITNVANPVSATDAANKAYVDGVAAGVDAKESVRAATTANITLSNTQTIDGVALAAGDRVLVKNQTTAADNGIYVVVDAGAWTRATDFDENDEVTANAYTFVEEGTVNGDNGYVLVTNDPITVGTTAQSWVQFSGAGQVIAGTGLTKTGNTLDVGAGDGITVGADTVSLASSVAGAGLTYTSGVVDVVGTADRISVAADSIDIAATYVGQSSITTLGTITTGTWNADTIGVAYGGTGLTTVAARALLVGNGTSAMTVLAGATTAGSFLAQDDTGNPFWTNEIDGGTY